MNSWIVLAILLGVGFAPVGNAPQPANAQSVPTPGESGMLQFQQIVKALTGRWSYVQTRVPPAAAQNTSRGVESWQPTTGGLTFTEDNVTRSTAGDLHDSAVLWWDGKARKIRGLWCADINDEGANGFDARLDGTDIVMEGEWEFEGKRTAWKEVFTMKGPDTFTQSLYFGSPGGALKLGSTIEATRLPKL